MKIGYVRVSKHEQNEALQIDALKALNDLRFLRQQVASNGCPA